MRILIFGMVNAPNLGDPIIYECLRKKLENRGHKITSCDFSGVPRSLDGSVLECQNVKVGSLLRSWLGKWPFVAAQVNKVRWLVNKYKIKNRYLALVDDVDLVVIGGGQLITDIYFGLPMRFDVLMDVFHENEIKYGIAFCGVGAKFSYSGAKVYRNLVAGSEFVFLRGERSRETLANIVPKAKSLDVVVDPVFACSKEFAGGEKKSNSLGVCYQGFRTLRMHLEAIERSGKNGLDQIIKDIIDQHIACGQRINIFTNGDPEDFLEAHEFYSEFYSDNESVVLCPRPTSALELIGTVSGFKKVVSFRMHAAIIAYSYGAKVINFVWDEKVREVWRQFGALDVIEELTCLRDENFDWVRRLDAVSVDMAKIEKADRDIEHALDRLLTHGS